MSDLQLRLNDDQRGAASRDARELKTDLERGVAQLIGLYERRTGLRVKYLHIGGLDISSVCSKSRSELLPVVEAEITL